MSLLQALSFLYKMFKNYFSNVVRNIIPVVAWKAIGGGTGRTLVNFREFSYIDIRLLRVLKFLQKHFLHVCQKCRFLLKRSCCFAFRCRF